MRRIKYVFLFALSLLFFILPKNEVSAKKPLDEIQSFSIDATVLDDATIDFIYTIEWKVLDSSSEGPLEWVKIGVPNHKIGNIRKLSDTISDIDYYRDDGDYIRCDFKHSYYKDDIVTFSFSFHAKYMFSLVPGDNMKIDYTPGWFDSIEVKKLTIQWHGPEAITAVGGNQSLDLIDGTYSYETSLSMGEKANVCFEYRIYEFPNADLGMSSKNMPHYVDVGLIIFFSVIALVILIIVLCSVNAHDPYYSARGFTDYHPIHYSYIHVYHGTYYNKKGTMIKDPRTTSGGFHGGHSGGHSCACACACACAGGGRAGCARKDFYHPNLEAKRAVEALVKDNDTHQSKNQEIMK